MMQPEKSRPLPLQRLFPNCTVDSLALSVPYPFFYPLQKDRVSSGKVEKQGPAASAQNEVCLPVTCTHRGLASEKFKKPNSETKDMSHTFLFIYLGGGRGRS